VVVQTIDETAAMIRTAGGSASTVRVDHTSERKVTALFRRLLLTRHRIDVVVDSVTGEDPLLKHHGCLSRRFSGTPTRCSGRDLPRASSRRSMPRSR
jgi:hypothetical protein